jgi:hypothetical protein
MKKSFLDMRAILWSAALAGAGLAGSFLVAVKLMGDIYYAEWLTASCLALFVLIAWLSHLRDDRLMKRSHDDPISEKDPVQAGSSGRQRRILVQAALLLGLASIVMYFGFGIGAALHLAG